MEIKDEVIEIVRKVLLEENMRYRDSISMSEIIVESIMDDFYIEKKRRE